MADEFNVEIANLATGFFGEDDQIRSPDDDSKPARTVRAVWSLVRKFVHSKANWSHGLRTVNLSARAANGAFPLVSHAYAYPLPARFARLARIVEPKGARDAYAIQRGPAGREILTDYAGPLTIEYVEDVEDPARWSPEFVEAFAMRLAWQICDRLSGDKGRKKDAENAYRAALSEARGSDARQQAPRDHAATPWTSARRDVSMRAPNT
jgi:hypothetical protein